MTFYVYGWVDKNQGGRQKKCAPGPMDKKRTDNKDAKKAEGQANRHIFFVWGRGMEGWEG